MLVRKIFQFISRSAIIWPVFYTSNDSHSLEIEKIVCDRCVFRIPYSIFLVCVCFSVVLSFRVLRLIYYMACRCIKNMLVILHLIASTKSHSRWWLIPKGACTTDMHFNAKMKDCRKQFSHWKFRLLHNKPVFILVWFAFLSFWTSQKARLIVQREILWLR